MKKRIEGIVTPVITPLLPNGKVDFQSVKRHQDYLIAGGVSAVFALGTTGGGPALSDFVQQEMIVASVEAVAGRVPVLAGVSAASPEKSLEMAHFAAQNGVTGVVAAPPCYLPLEPEEVYEFYRILASEQPLPVYVYNMPSMTKIAMSPELIIRIAGIPGIAGYKDSAGVFEDFSKVCAALKEREDFSLFMGPDRLLGQAVQIGACGGVNSGSNLAPEFFTGMLAAAKAGDQETMDKLQTEIMNMRRIYKIRQNGSGVAVGLVKALSLLGLCRNELYRPAQTLGDEPVITEFISHLMELRRTK